MAKKKKVSKKTKPAPAEAPGTEVVSEPAHVEEPFIKVRGTALGGTKLMTQSEFDDYCASQKK